MRKYTIFISIFILIVLDQLSKWWVVANIRLNQVIAAVPNLFSLTYLRNYGAAFSILQNQQWFFTLITLTVIGAAVFYLIRRYKESLWLVMALSLIIAGGLGNFLDRLRLGYVVDMIHLDFMDFAVFNVADSYLTVGVALLILILWKEDDGSHH
ncbi:signal peptidase II [Streptococcus dentiloxodontae]